MGKSKNWVSLGVLLALLALTLWIVFRGQDPGELAAALRQARPGWLCLGGALSLCAIAWEAAGTRIVLRTLGRRVPYHRCLAFSAAGFYFSSITPSATGGQPAQVFYMARLGIPAALGALDMLLLTVAYQVVSVLYALFAWLVSPGITASLGTGLGVLLGYGAVTMLLLTGMVGMFLFRPEPARQLCLWFLRLGARLRLVRDPAGSEARLDAQMEEYRRGAAVLRERPWLLPALLVTTGAQLSCTYLIPWTVYRALGCSGAGALTLLSTQALLSLAVGCLPIPGAVGASEAAFLSVFRQLFGAGLLPAAMLLARGLAFYLPLVYTGVAAGALHLRSGGKNG